MDCEESAELRRRGAGGDGAAWNRLGELTLLELPEPLSTPTVQGLLKEPLEALERRRLGLNCRANEAFDREYWDSLDIWERELVPVTWAIRIREVGVEQACRELDTERERIFKEALEYFQRSARLGDPEGMWNCGWRYFLGEGVGRNDRNAILYWAHAAARGHAAAARQLAEMTLDETLRHHVPW